MRKIKTFLYNLVYYLPKAGDMVKVATGFSSFCEEGIVSKVCKDETGKYCWIDQYYKDGRYKRSFIASFSYCTFHFIK